MSRDQRFSTYVGLCLGVWIGELLFLLSLAPYLSTDVAYVIRLAGLVLIPFILWLDEKRRPTEPPQ